MRCEDALVKGATMARVLLHRVSLVHAFCLSVCLVSTLERPEPASAASASLLLPWRHRCRDLFARSLGYLVHRARRTGNSLLGADGESLRDPSMILAIRPSHPGPTRDCDAMRTLSVPRGHPDLRVLAALSTGRRPWLNFGEPR